MSSNHNRNAQRIIVTCLFVVGLIATSCSSTTTTIASDGTTDAPTDAAPSEQSEDTAAVDNGASTTDPATDAATEAPTDVTNEASEPEPPAPGIPEIADVPGLPLADGVEIQQLTPRSGGGDRPILAWNAVAAADSYSVVVYDAQGAAWWSWAGADTQVVIGGVDTDANIGGPRADIGVRWSVFAFDTEGNLVGNSPKRSLEP